MSSPLVIAARTGEIGLVQRWTQWLLRSWYTPRLSHKGHPPWRPLSSFLELGARFYARGVRRHQSKAMKARRGLPAFVISVGNMVVGGTGKTPLTLWLVDYLCTRGWSPVILSRGYGRSSTKPARVPAQGELAALAACFGDEPVLMARKAQHVPVWVGSDRFHSGLAAMEASGADVLVLDDGFQHLRLLRSLDLVLLDAHLPFGNGLLLPSGPLREPIEHLERAHAMILTRAENAAKTDETRRDLAALFPGKPLFTCRHRLIGFKVAGEGPVLSPVHFLKAPVLAFAGIARPEMFFRDLRELGLTLSRTFSFPDHHSYGSAELSLLMDCLHKESLRFLITTEKDAVRLPPQLRAVALVAELEIDFGDSREAFQRYLDERCGRHNPDPCYFLSTG